MTRAAAKPEEPRYFGSWTITYMLKGKRKPREFTDLQGWTEKQAIQSALNYLSGWEVKIVCARKQQKRQVQIALQFDSEVRP